MFEPTNLAALSRGPVAATQQPSSRAHGGRLAQVPENPVIIARPSRATGRQQVLVRRVLRARRIRVRHPDGRQAEHVGEAVVGQRSAEVGQDRRRRARSSRRSTPRRAAPTDASGSRRVACIIVHARRRRPRRCANPCASRCARSAGTKRAGSQPTTKRSCSVRRRARRDRVDRMLGIAGHERQHFERCSTRTRARPASAPARPNRASIAGPPGSPGSMSASARAHRRRDRRRPQARRPGSGRAHRPARRSRWRGSCPGLASRPPQLPE